MKMESNSFIPRENCFFLESNHLLFQRKWEEHYRAFWDTKPRPWPVSWTLSVSNNGDKLNVITRYNWCLRMRPKREALKGNWGRVWCGWSVLPRKSALHRCINVEIAVAAFPNWIFSTSLLEKACKYVLSLHLLAQALPPSSVLLNKIWKFLMLNQTSLMNGLWDESLYSSPELIIPTHNPH